MRGKRRREWVIVSWWPHQPTITDWSSGALERWYQMFAWWSLLPNWLLVSMLSVSHISWGDVRLEKCPDSHLIDFFPHRGVLIQFIFVKIFMNTTTPAFFSGIILHQKIFKFKMTKAIPTIFINKLFSLDWIVFVLLKVKVAAKQIWYGICE